MRIVIVKPVLPWPPNQGTKRVTLALIRALRPEHDVTLVAPLLSSTERESARELEDTLGCRVVSALAPNRRSLFHRVWHKGLFAVRSLVGGHSPRALYSSPGNLIRAAQTLAHPPFDLAIFEYWYSYRWIDRLAARRKVLLAHDAEFSVNNLARQSGAASRRFWEGNEARREREACRAVNQVWTLTDADAGQLARTAGLPRDRFLTLPFGVDTRALNLAAGGGESVLFFGSFAADFNRDALDFLLDAVWPRIAARGSGARLVVAGGGLPERERRRVQASGGTFLGEVADLAELYQMAAVVLIPLRFGGGLRIRLLEALACSRAVVGTSVAVAGLTGGGEKPWWVRDGAEAVASGVSDLLAQPEERIRLGERGRRFVEEHYSEEKAAERTRQMVRDVTVGAI